MGARIFVPLNMPALSKDNIKNFLNNIKEYITFVYEIIKANVLDIN